MSKTQIDRRLTTLESRATAPGAKATPPPRLVVLAGLSLGEVNEVAKQNVIVKIIRGVSMDDI
jgi:hypothetical protein